jgi:hypothetical protein
MIAEHQGWCGMLQQTNYMLLDSAIPAIALHVPKR